MFEKQFFQPRKFTSKQLKQYLSSAKRNLDTAEEVNIPEVRFKFSYEAFIKIGITLIAKKGFKVRSQPGHHVKIIEKLSLLLKNEDIAILGNKMRKVRNSDFYDGGVLISRKDSDEYLSFVKKF